MRAAVFRALVAVPLPAAGREEVTGYATWALGADAPEHLDAIAPAAWIPLRSVRDLVEQLARDGSPDERALARAALARADAGVAAGRGPEPDVAPPARVEGADRDAVRDRLARLERLDPGGGPSEACLRALERGRPPRGLDRLTFVSVAVALLFAELPPGPPGAGDPLVELVERLAVPPDLRGLCDAGWRQGGRSDLLAQIAWCAARAPLAALLSELAAELGSGGDRGLAALLVELAATWRGSSPPRWRDGEPERPPLRSWPRLASARPPTAAEPPRAEVAANGGEHAAPPAAADAEAAPGHDGGETRAEPAAGPRVLQARVDDLSDAGAPVPLERGFRAGGLHRFHVAIAPRRVGWLGVDGESFDDALGPQREALVLTVVLNAVGSAPPAQALQQTQLLLAVGRPAETAFDFELLPDLAEARIELEVRAGQRTIQAATLRGPVASDPAALPAAARIELLLGPKLAHDDALPGRAPFHAAISAGPTGVTACSASALVKLDTSRLDAAARALEEFLADQITADAATAGSLDDPAALETLYGLAVRGGQLYDAIGAEIETRLGRDLSRVQLLLRTETQLLPLELVYDLPAPGPGAALCTNWRKALSTGRCADRFHARAADGNAACVCPSGFWGVSKVIERQLAPDGTFSTDDAAFDTAVGAEATPDADALELLGGGLLAASALVRPPDVERVCKSLRATSGRSRCVTSWREWVETVDEVSPTLLVLLSHTVEDEVVGRALEIGRDDRRAVRQITESYVSRLAAPRLLVLLLGCETAESARELQSFVARFRLRGASLVVGTVASVGAERAPRVAAQLVRALARAARRKRPTTAGEVLLAVRRDLVRRGELTALALVAYGDADWRLGGEA